ncbi:hypothetical protein PtA15_4A45 [Puccinia triticina]|uniref:Uncharacterized protein n=1 Tax=Puccinia triticina TaxID=208348 RepID=A0ABY7CI32_9BASI|nr:uncharacterized protein PtA15_4A45 [Puccinia triticina]WAQ83597.1 hypothetical protein PtA15_4A45 [Puccinia triticina]WAR54423.1 hypothetical protein PtB15_4B40 [Puccinia triticina]
MPAASTDGLGFIPSVLLLRDTSSGYLHTLLSVFSLSFRLGKTRAPSVASHLLSTSCAAVNLQIPHLAADFPASNSSVKTQEDLKPIGTLGQISRINAIHPRYAASDTVLIELPTRTPAALGLTTLTGLTRPDSTSFFTTSQHFRILIQRLPHLEILSRRLALPLVGQLAICILAPRASSHLELTSISFSRQFDPLAKGIQS